MDVFKLKNLITLLFFVLSLNDAHSQARVVFVKGESHITRGQKTIKINTDTDLKNEDLVVTGKDGLVIVKSKASTYKISRNSELQIDLNTKEIINSNINYGSVVVDFISDRLYKSRGETLQITSKSAAFGVRGTKFFSYVDREHQHSVLSVEHGSVSFKGTNSALETIVKNNKSSITNIKNKQLEAKNFGFENEINWNLSARKGALVQSDELFSALDKTWSKYKNENEKSWDKRSDEMESLWKKQ
jgi:hypothetical protein